MTTKEETNKLQKEQKMNTNNKTAGYAARLEVDYPEKLDRLTTFFRILWIIPIAIILGLISGAGETITNTVFLNEAGEVIRRTQQTAGGLVVGLVAATALMILFRQLYPRWWFDFSRELTRFEARVGAYAALLTDRYPSTVDEQSVHLEIDYPNVETDLNRWLSPGQVAARDPALLRPVLSQHCQLLCSDPGLVRHSGDRSIPEEPL